MRPLPTLPNIFVNMIFCNREPVPVRLCFRYSYRRGEIKSCFRSAISLGSTGARLLMLFGTSWTREGSRFRGTRNSYRNSHNEGRLLCRPLLLLHPGTENWSHVVALKQTSGFARAQCAQTQIYKLGVRAICPTPFRESFNPLRPATCGQTEIGRLCGSPIVDPAAAMTCASSSISVSTHSQCAARRGRTHSPGGKISAGGSILPGMRATASDRDRPG